jgi:hypothetical protein
MSTAQVKRQPKPLQADVEEEQVYDAIYNTRTPSSVRRYHSRPPQHADTQDDLHDEPFIQQRRASRLIQPVPRKHTPNNHDTSSKHTTAPQPVETTKARTLPQGRMLPRVRRFSPVPVMVGMVIMIVLVMSASLVLSWWQVFQDNLHYGYPRTYQMDAVVGHNDSPAHPTHFIFLNLNRHVEIIEIPGGDPSKARIYAGPVLYGNGEDLVPVTGEIRDDNGRKDLVVHIQNQEILFINDGTSFHSQ